MTSELKVISAAGPASPLTPKQVEENFYRMQDKIMATYETGKGLRTLSDRQMKAVEALDEFMNAFYEGNGSNKE